jgi:hypothetical protein
LNAMQMLNRKGTRAQGYAKCRCETSRPSVLAVKRSLPARLRCLPTKFHGLPIPSCQSLNDDIVLVKIEQWNRKEYNRIKKNGQTVEA